jgi:hypothetical protein
MLFAQPLCMEYEDDPGDIVSNILSTPTYSRQMRSICLVHSPALFFSSYLHRVFFSSSHTRATLSRCSHQRKEFLYTPPVEVCVCRVYYTPMKYRRHRDYILGTMQRHEQCMHSIFPLTFFCSFISIHIIK